MISIQIIKSLPGQTEFLNQKNYHKTVTVGYKHTQS